MSCFNIVQSLRELLLECPEYLRTERGLNEYNEAERSRFEQIRQIANQEFIPAVAARRQYPEWANQQQDNGQQPEGENAVDPAPPPRPPRPPRPHFLGEGRNVFRFVNRHFFPNLNDNNPGENLIRIINRAEVDPPANQPPNQQPNNNNNRPPNADDEQQRPVAPLAPLPPVPENPEIRRQVRILYNNRRNIIRIINQPERNNNVEDNNNELQQNQQRAGGLPPPVEAAYQQIFEAGNRDRAENGPAGGEPPAGGDQAIPVVDQPAPREEVRPDEEAPAVPDNNAIVVNGDGGVNGRNDNQPAVEQPPQEEMNGE